MENLLFTIALAVIGWLARAVEKLNETVAALRLELQTQYISKAQCKENMEKCTKCEK